MPFAILMGVEIKDAFKVAELLGIKTFLTEFLSYKRLGEMIQFRVQQYDGRDAAGTATLSVSESCCISFLSKYK